MAAPSAEIISADIIDPVATPCAEIISANSINLVLPSSDNIDPVAAPSAEIISAEIISADIVNPVDALSADIIDPVLAPSADNIDQVAAPSAEIISADIIDPIKVQSSFKSNCSFFDLCTIPKRERKPRKRRAVHNFLLTSDSHLQFVKDSTEKKETKKVSNKEFID